MASWAGWTLTRLVVLALFVATPHLGNDVNYWSQSLAAGDGPDATLVEYPVPAYVLLWVPWFLTRLADGTPTAVFLGLALALDAAFHALLVRRRPSGRLALAGEITWIAAAPALGAVSVLHFDIVTGVLVGAALLLTTRAPGTAAALATIATGVKYWPAIVLPGVVLGAGSRRRAAWSAVLTGSVLAIGSLLVSTPQRLITPLSWQGDRGLQMESIAATPGVVGHLVDPDRFTIAFTHHLSYEVFGPGTTTALAATSVGSLLVALLLALLWWRGRGGLTGDALVWLTLAAVAGFVVVDKVFSPQYLLWLTPVAAAGLVVVQAAERSRLAVWTVGLVSACVLTQAGPVLGLGPIIDSGHGDTMATIILVARNGLMVALFAAAGARALRLSAAREPSTGCAERERSGGAAG